MQSKVQNIKIGIITYHRPINYGAILQAYALQKIIKGLGIECEILDYRNSKLEELHKKKTINSKNLKHLIRDLLLLKNHNIKYEKFREFLSENLELSDPLYCIEDLNRIEVNYNKFITGSDQVWNYKINNMDPAYFLDFTENKSKKASYAASFGVSDIPDELRQKYFDYLHGFDVILTREKRGADIITELLSKESHVVLDPTLLVSKEEWLKIAQEKYSINEKYILVYAFGGSNNITNLAKKLSKNTGYKVLWISNTYKLSNSIKYIKSAGPKEFLSLLINAEYVITNSFHGTAFSINFNKQFFTEFLPESKGTNSRMEDILDLFGLKDRIIYTNDSKLIDSLIDYNTVNSVLIAERKRSIHLLQKICNSQLNQIN